MTEIGSATMTIHVSPVIDEDALEVLRQRLEAVLVTPFHPQPMPPAAPAGRNAIQPPAGMVAGATMMHQAGGEWSEVIPGLECKFAGITAPGGQDLNLSIAEATAKAVLQFRLTPQGE